MSIACRNLWLFLIAQQRRSFFVVSKELSRPGKKSINEASPSSPVFNPNSEGEQ